MKFSIYKTLLLLTVLFLSSQSKADSAIDATGKIYVQAGYSSLNINYGNYSYNIGSTYTAYLGGNFNKYFGLENSDSNKTTTAATTWGEYINSYIWGMVFGLGLGVSGMCNPSRVINFLNFSGSEGWDPSLMAVMGK